MALHLLSGGISFSDFADSTATNASTDSELLNDYESGTWTPTVISGGSISPNYSPFAKVGSIVKINSYVSHTGDSSDAHKYGGVPFVSGTGSYFTGTAQSAANGPPGMVLRLETASSSISVFVNTNASGQVYVTGTTLNGSHNMLDIVFIEAL